MIRMLGLGHVVGLGMIQVCACEVLGTFLAEVKLCDKGIQRSPAAWSG